LSTKGLTSQRVLPMKPAHRRMDTTCG